MRCACDHQQLWNNAQCVQTQCIVRHAIVEVCVNVVIGVLLCVLLVVVRVVPIFLVLML